MKKTQKYLIKKMEVMLNSTTKGCWRKPDPDDWSIIEIDEHGYHPYFRGGYTTYYRSKKHPHIGVVTVCDLYSDVRDRWLYTPDGAISTQERLAMKRANLNWRR